MNWQDIKTIPDDGKQVLVGFVGQFHWYSYVVHANGCKTSYAGYAESTHWCEIIPPIDVGA